MNYELSFTVTGCDALEIAKAAEAQVDAYYARRSSPDDAPTGPVAAYEHEYTYSVRPLVQPMLSNCVEVWEADVTVRLVPV